LQEWLGEEKRWKVVKDQRTIRAAAYGLRNRWEEQVKRQNANVKWQSPFAFCDLRFAF
jgi:hypothetical protein